MECGDVQLFWSWLPIIVLHGENGTVDSAAGNVVRSEGVFGTRSS